MRYLFSLVNFWAAILTIISAPFKEGRAGLVKALRNKADLFSQGNRVWHHASALLMAWMPLPTASQCASMMSVEDITEGRRVWVFRRFTMLVLSLINPERNARNSFRSCCIFDAGSSGSNANAFPISANILASTASVFARTPWACANRRAGLHKPKACAQTDAPAKDSPSPMVNVRPGRVQARRGKPQLLHKQRVPLPSLRRTWKVP